MVASEMVRHSAPAALPVGYIAFVDILSDPMKLAGLIVLVLQGVYIVIQIVKSLRDSHANEI